MMAEKEGGQGAGRRSVLFVHYQDISTPIGTTVPHYLTRELSDRYDVHVLCPKQAGEHTVDYADRVTNVYHVPVGTIPIVSSLAYTALATVLAVVLGLRYRFAAVYAYKSALIQGYAASLAGQSMFVVGLQAAPIRQRREFGEFGAFGSQGTVKATVQGALRRSYSKVLNRLLVRADEIVCLTAGIRRLTSDEFGLDSGDMHVIGMGIDQAFFQAETDPGMDNDGPWVVTYVGTVDDTRNIHEVVEAISKTNATFEFRIVGRVSGESYRDEVDTLASSLGVEDHVTWCGYVDHEEIPDILAQTDFAISPLPDLESYRVSFPAKLLEYLSSGSIVVCSDIAPHERLIAHRENGYLYDGSVDGLVDVLDVAVEDQEAHREISAAATETASEYDWERIVTRHEAVIFEG